MAGSSNIERVGTQNSVGMDAFDDNHFQNSTSGINDLLYMEKRYEKPQSRCTLGARQSQISENVHFDEFNQPGTSRLLDFEQHSYAPDFGDKNVQMSRSSAFLLENTRPIVYMPKLAQLVPLKQKIWADKFVDMKDLIQLG